MKIKLVFPFFVAGIMLAGLFFLLNIQIPKSAFAKPISGSTLCVDPGDVGCYSTIQSAIDDADPGDTVLVDGGVITYNEHITMTHGVSVIGQGWITTTIDGGYSQSYPGTVYFLSGITETTVFSGFKVTGGGDRSLASGQGGGLTMYNTSPKVINTWVFSNTAKDGGGVFVQGGAPVFENVPVWDNRADRGGGFYIRGGADVTIVSDFIGTNGTVINNSALQDGGGIYINDSGADISGLRFFDNQAWYGSALNVENTTQRVKIHNNKIGFLYLGLVPFYNTALSWGGGIGASSAQKLEIINNTIGYNRANIVGGAGVFLNHSAGIIKNNQFVGNLGAEGGGVYISGISHGLILQGNTFRGNLAYGGGGVCLNQSSGALIDSNVIISNTSDIAAGMSIYDQNSVTITNNIIARNIISSTPKTAGGIQLIDSNAVIVNNTIADNDADGLWISNVSASTILNNIIAGNSGDGVEADLISPSTFTFDYNDVFGNSINYNNVTAGSNDMSVNPLFTATGGTMFNYYHIQPSSPVSATGYLAVAPPVDIDMEPRGTEGTASMGADEIPAPLTYTYIPTTFK
jgi:parallel beta-helix repeat protein